MLGAIHILLAGAAFGQGVHPVPQPRPVDQGYADRDALSRSLRRIEPGLQQDQSFRVLYEVPGRPDLLMRRSGSIIAVFPRSLYVETRDGVVPMIPAGAVFYIGGLPADLGAPGGSLPTGGPNAPAPYSPLRTSNQVTGRVDSALRTPPVNLAAPLALAPPLPPRPGEALPPPPEADASTQPPLPGPPPPTVFTNETYRKRRLAQILSSARAGEQARAGDE